MDRLRYVVVLATIAAAPVAPIQPDPELTPGAVRQMTKTKVCATRWGLDRRHVTAAMKRRVFTAYGFPKGNADPRCPCEIDHRVPRELAGADLERNLWVESYRGLWNARMKDRLENAVHDAMCRTSMSLREGQAYFFGDWHDGYVEFFGEPYGGNGRRQADLYRL